MSEEEEVKQLMKNVFFISEGNVEEVEAWLNLFYN